MVPLSLGGPCFGGSGSVLRFRQPVQLFRAERKLNDLAPHRELVGRHRHKLPAYAKEAAGLDVNRFDLALGRRHDLFNLANARLIEGMPSGDPTVK